MSIISFTTVIHQPRSLHRHSNGFTLIEVLVTIIVVSIGLLGLAGLQIGGLRANMSSEARSKATLLANDIVERMRANPLGVAAGAYSNIDTEVICAGAPPVPFCASDNSDDIPLACTTVVEMAAFDAWTWGCDTAAAGVQRNGVNDQLPNGTATVTCNDNNPDDGIDCSPGSSHTVTINWNELNPSATREIGSGENVLQTITLVVVP